MTVMEPERRKRCDTGDRARVDGPASVLGNLLLSIIASATTTVWLLLQLDLPGVMMLPIYSVLGSLFVFVFAMLTPDPLGAGADTRSG